MPAARKTPAYTGSAPYKLDIEAERAAMVRARKRAMKSKASATRFLQRAGILDKTGELAEEYQSS